MGQKILNIIASSLSRDNSPDKNTLSRTWSCLFCLQRLPLAQGFTQPQRWRGPTSHCAKGARPEVVLLKLPLVTCYSRVTGLLVGAWAFKASSPHLITHLPSGGSLWGPHLCFCQAVSRKKSSPDNPVFLLLPLGVFWYLSLGWAGLARNKEWFDLIIRELWGCFWCSYCFCPQCDLGCPTCLWACFPTDSKRRLAMHVP